MQPSNLPRHDTLRSGDPCPVSGKPYDGYSWSVGTPYDSCRACSPGHPMGRGVAVSLAELSARRSAPTIDAQDPALWTPARSAIRRRGFGFDGAGADGDTMASLPGFPTWHGRQTVANVVDEVSAGLDWSVMLAPLGASINGRPYRVPGFAAHRSDNGTVLGTVGGEYVPLHPRDLMTLARGTAAALGTRVEAAGSFAGGRDTFALIGLPGGRDGDGTLGGGSWRMLLHSPNDGTGSVSAGATLTVVCCQNTLSLALRGEGLARVRHVGDNLAERVAVYARAGAEAHAAGRDLVALVERSEALEALRRDELADFTAWTVEGSLSTRARSGYSRAAASPLNRLEGRTRAAQVAQVATWYATHEAGRDSMRSTVVGARRGALQSALSELAGMSPDKGRESVERFRKALAEALN